MEARRDFDPSRWQGTVLLLETALHDFARRQDSSVEQRVGHVLTVLVSMVRSGVVDSLAAVQEFQRHRPEALFQLAARPVAELNVPAGVMCLDILTDEPRDHALDVVLDPAMMSEQDSRAAYLADHERNLALLGEVGVLQTSVASPQR